MFTHVLISNIEFDTQRSVLLRQADIQHRQKILVGTSPPRGSSPPDSRQSPVSQVANRPGTPARSDHRGRARYPPDPSWPDEPGRPGATAPGATTSPPPQRWRGANSTHTAHIQQVDGGSTAATGSGGSCGGGAATGSESV